MRYMFFMKRLEAAGREYADGSIQKEPITTHAERRKPHGNTKEEYANVVDERNTQTEKEREEREAEQ